MLLYAHHAEAQEQEYTQLSALEQRLDSVQGYSKGQLLLQLAQGYSSLSVTKSLDYCEQLRALIHEISPEKIFDSQSQLSNLPDSILEMRAQLYFLMGQCYFTLDELPDTTVLMESQLANKKKARHFFEVLLKIRQHQQDPLKIAEAHNAMAVVLAALNQGDSAMMYYQNNLRIYQELNDRTGLAKTYNNIAVYYRNDSIDKALRYFRIAMRFAHDEGNTNAYLVAVSNLVDIYTRKRNFSMAIQYLGEVIPVCKERKNYMVLKGFYLQLSNIYAMQGRYKEAYDYQELYIQVRDSLVDIETVRHINEMAAKYQTDRQAVYISELTKMNHEKEIEMEMGRRLLQTQRTWVVIATVISVLALVAFALAFRETRRRRKANLQLEKANDSLTLSLKYASRLQRIIIRGDREAQSILSDFFVIYKPKNIVSGDFYYVRDFDTFRVVAVADCTGHGVPAAFLSVLNITFFNEIFTTASHVPDPAQVLDTVRRKIIVALNQTSDLYSSTDGMDCALMLIDSKTHQVRYAGAYIDVYVMRHATGKIELVRSTHNPISWYFKQMPFASSDISLDPDDVVYMFSDGYPDQVDSHNTGKFTKVRLRKEFEQMWKMSLPDQKKHLLEVLAQWQGTAEQIDDVLMLGIRASSLYQ